MTKMGEKMFRLRLLHAILWKMTFQLTFVTSKQQNLPGYLGCFGDSTDRALPAISESSNEQFVERCFRHCLEPTQFKYAGLEYSYECYCGNNEDYDKHGEKPESDCQDSCAGNSNQICGDSWSLSVYRVSDGVCSNDIGPPTKGEHAITNPRSLSYNLNNFKFFGTRVDFSCDPGYTLHGASSIECIATDYNNVTWSDSVPTCEVSTNTTIPTTSAPTTTHLQSTVTDSLMTSGNSTTDRTPSSTDFPSETPGDNEPNTGALQTGAIVGIAVGAGVLTTLILLVVLLCKKRKRNKKSPDVRGVTFGDSYTNNAYALPEIVSQSITDQSTMPIYSQVIKNKTDSDDVYATPDDITSPDDNENVPSDQPKGVAPSRDQESGWVENTLYMCESFPAEPTTRVNYSDGQTNSGPPLTMEGKPGWVENIIYE
ncbi:uncharacterized protein LOC119727159 isoform X2 [Patiria miniata]|uniref:WSC domain-containing protein n=1 Tax=Patiria miniata TaxID=46514 RepID=A0A913ZV49_PATMI|nr:uncharacterized protein LOC119727159 isoform X2 [Patiria miniata]